MKQIFIRIFNCSAVVTAGWLLAIQVCTSTHAFASYNVAPATGPAISAFFQAPQEVERYESLAFLPGSLSGEVVLDAGDLGTHAEEVFSAAVYRENRKIGMLLAVKSIEEVVEPAKYAIELLKGVEVKSIFTHDFRNIFPFVVSEYHNTEGKTEYSCSFSAYQDANQVFAIESHWNREDYTRGQTYYSFQLWAENMEKLEIMVGEIITKLSQMGPIGEIYTTKAPKVFISKQNNQNNILTLQVVNRSGARQITIYGNTGLPKKKGPAAYEMQVSLSGQEFETVAIPVDNHFQIVGNLKVKRNTTPALPPNPDGAWGVFFDQLAANITSFDVQENKYEVKDEAKYFGRDLTVKGTISGEIMAQRTFNPDGLPQDLSKFNAITFDVEGIQELQVVLIKASIDDFLAQPVTTIKIKPGVSKVILQEKDFFQIEDLLDWDDVKAMVFRMAAETPNQPLNFSLRNLTAVNYSTIPTENCNCSNTEENDGEGVIFAGRNRKH